MLAALRLDGGDAAVFLELDISHLVEHVSDATLGRDVSQVVGKFLRIEMKRVRERRPKVPLLQHQRRHPEMAERRLCRHRLHVRNRTVAHQPLDTGVVYRRM